MQKVKHLVRNLICVFLVVSCNSSVKENEVVRPPFPEQIILDGEAILDSTTLAISIFDLGSQIVISKLKSSHFFDVYEKQSLARLYAFAPQGDGAFEWNMPAFYGQYEKINGDIYIWLNEINKGELVKVKLSDSDSLSILKKFSYPISKRLANHLWYVSDSLWIAGIDTDDTEPAVVKLYNPQSSQLQTILSPVEYTVEARQARVSPYVTHASRIAVNSQRKLVAVAYEKLDIYSFEGELLKSIIGNENTSQLSITDLLSEECYSYYNSLHATSKYIYALYYRQKEADYNEVSIPVSVHVLDWEGNMIKEIKVNDYLLSISVDSNDEWLYGVNYFNEKNLRYKLK